MAGALEHGELVAEVFEKNGTSDEYLTEIRMPLNQGIVGHVAVSQKKHALAF